MKQFSLTTIPAKYVYKMLLITWVITKLISFNLWFQVNRLFPRIPAFQFLSFNGFEALDFTMAIFSFGLILLALFKPKSSLILLLVITEILLCIFDLLRIQPFQFQLIVLSLIYVWKPKRFHINLLLLLSATYFFAGLSKFNLGFINVYWSYFFLENTLNIPRVAHVPFVKAVGFSIPFLESMAGLLLLSKYSKIACKALILFHVATLWFIGPFHLNINQAVWPWNMSMILLLLYFHTQPKFDLISTFFKPIVQKVYITILFVFPLLGYTNYYHPYTSFKLYEGKEIFLLLQSTSPFIAEFHSEKYHRFAPEENYYSTLARTITFSELNVPVASVPWLHHRIIEVIQQHKNFEKTKFYYLAYPYKEVSDY